jgi:Spy/CpxP family protein refolding chaperone
MRFVSTVLTLAALLAFAGTLRAADEGKGHHGKHSQSPMAWAAPRIDKLTLTDDQKTKVADLQKEFAPKVDGLLKKQLSVVTDEQHKAAHEAEKEAKAAGKSGKEIHEAGAAALKLTDEQKTQMADIQKELQPFRLEALEKLKQILTPDQFAQLKASHGGGHKAKKADN